MNKANIYAYFSDMSLFTLRGVSNKHCLLPLFSFKLCIYKRDMKLYITVNIKLNSL